MIPEAVQPIIGESAIDLGQICPKSGTNFNMVRGGKPNSQTAVLPKMYGLVKSKAENCQKIAKNYR